MKLNNRLWPITGLLLSFFLTTSVIAETEYRVKSFDTLNHVVTKFYPFSSYSRAQIMVAILAKNPRAFSDGNINLLLKGRVLVLPIDNEISGFSNSDARQLLAQHEISFRSGIRGFDLNLAATQDNAVTATAVKKQTQKINKLKEESATLRKQLDNLFVEKQQRDKELVELEETIQEYSEKEKIKIQSDPAFQVEVKNEKLQATNEILRKKLIESKSELAENARSTMTLERKIDNLRDRMSLSPDGSVAGGVAKGQEEAVPSSSMGSSFKDTLFWVLPLLLVAAVLFMLWLLIKWFMGRAKRKPAEEKDYEKDYAALIEEYESTDYLNPDNIEEEVVLETSIKLDVARAYIEADDIESALNILEEIMKEGSVDQKKEAQEILSFINNI